MIFDFIERLLLKQTTATASDECEARARFIGKFQQITSPVAAKGIEDTALYVLQPAAVAERSRRRPDAVRHRSVGGARVDGGAAGAAGRLRCRRLSTHDTKRGEDVRARLNVLSEIPGAWKDGGRQVADAEPAAPRRSSRAGLAPEPNEEYLLYQTLVGAWPFDERCRDPVRRFTDRIAAYMTKALREAKVHTSWLSPDEEYEEAVARFVRTHPRSPAAEPVSRSVRAVPGADRRARHLQQPRAAADQDHRARRAGLLPGHGAVGSDARRSRQPAAGRLSRAGARRWTAVPGAARRTPMRCSSSRRDGRVKLFVVHSALAARAAMRDVYERGAYMPLAASGARAECVFAFARSGSDPVRDPP